MITLEARVLGQRKPLVPQWSLPVPPEVEAGGSALTLRDLITHVVRTEVRAFRERQSERKLLRVLSPQQIGEALQRGKVSMGGEDLQQEVDEDAAVGTALQAFEDGLYLVLLDDEQQRDLDRQVFLRPDSRLTFLRLVAFAGG